MSYMHSTGEIIINETNWKQFINPVLPDGSVGHHGLIPRQYNLNPLGSYPWAKTVTFPLIPRAEWSARCATKAAEKSWLSDVRMTEGPNGGMIPSRDQNGRGYCWMHSGVSATLAARAAMGEPYADLSAYMGACIIKNYRDEGGWGAQGVDWLVKNGIPTSEFWPQRAVDRKYDTPAMRENAKKYTVLDQWADLTAGQYDRNLSFEQNATLFLSNQPTVVDFNWWSHSVCGLDLVDGSTQYSSTRMESGKLPQLFEFEVVWGMNDPVTAGFGIRIWNSWGDSWSQNGTGILTGNKAIPDGGVGIRLVHPA